MARLTLLKDYAIPAAGTVNSTSLTGLAEIGDLALYAVFDWTSGGTAVKAYVQSSIDGVNWFDIACFAFAGVDAIKDLSVSTAGDRSTVGALTDGALADDTVVTGLIGDKLRVKTIVTGTYVGTLLSIYAEARTNVAGGPSSLDAATLAALESITVVPTAGALTNRSGALAAGAAAENAAASLSTRKYFFLLNPLTETEILWFSTSATAVAASPSIPLYPGQSFEFNGFFCPTGAVSVIAATTGHKWIAREG